MKYPIKSGINLLLVSFVMTPSLHAQDNSDKKDRRTVTVQGQGKLDIATLIAGVTQDGPSLDNVSAQVRTLISKVLDGVKAQGIADKDIQTELYQVEPKYEQDKRGNSHPTGFVVTNRVAVKVHDLKKIGKTLSAIVSAGATTVEGPNFEFDNPQVLERKTLALAMEDAKAKAAVLAESGGASLGEVMTIDQSGGINWPMRRPIMARAAMMPAAAEPIETGEQAFNSNITVTFALK